MREKFTCRHCKKISQPPAPFHPTPRGWAGPNLLAMILFEKYHAGTGRHGWGRDRKGACFVIIVEPARAIGPSEGAGTSGRWQSWERTDA